MNLGQYPFDEGLGVINSAIRALLDRHGVAGATISCTLNESEPGTAVFNVTVSGRSEELLFTKDEIENSADGIEPSARRKVRLLVGQFRA